MQSGHTHATQACVYAQSLERKIKMKMSQVCTNCVNYCLAVTNFRHKAAGSLITPNRKKHGFTHINTHKGTLAHILIYICICSYMHTNRKVIQTYQMPVCKPIVSILDVCECMSPRLQLRSRKSQAFRVLLTVLSLAAHILLVLVHKLLLE